MPAASLLSLLWIALVGQRLLELRLARRNEAWARAQGAREVGARHYPLFFLLHGAWMLAWPLEAWARGLALAPAGWAFIAAFVLAQGLRYWAITTLGQRWNTRILVIPGAAPIRTGPYRFVSHPNYVAVAVELLSVPLAFGAVWTAGVASVLNLVLLLGIRIPAEARALAEAAEAPPGAG